MAVKPIPDGFNTVNAYLIVKDVEKAIDFYQRAFGGEPGTLMRMPDGKGVMHAEVRIGNSTVMLTGENPQWNARSAESLGGSPISLHVCVEDADKAFQRAIEAGGEAIMPMMDAFWGDRYGKLKDPFGIEWGVSTHKEDLTDVEIAERAKQWFAQMGDC